MTTLHVYSNRHVKDQVKNIKMDAWIYLQNGLSRKVWSLYFRYNNINEDALNITYITQEEFMDLSGVRFDVVVGNPPYQAPKSKNKKGTGGNNSLYIEFITNSIDFLRDGGTMCLITPPSALVKTTVLHKPTPTLEYIIKNGSIDSIDFTVKKHFQNVGSAICNWVFVKGKAQGPIKVTMNKFKGTYPIQDIFYLPPDSLDGKVDLTELEFNLFNKIISNTEGDSISVVRGKKNQECTMARFGYPKVRIGGDQELGFQKKFYEFFSSKLGLWLLDYVRRHDQLIYHNVLSGIVVPKDSFNLTEDESAWIDNGNWINKSTRDG